MHCIMELLSDLLFSLTLLLLLKLRLLISVIRLLGRDLDGLAMVGEVVVAVVALVLVVRLVEVGRLVGLMMLEGLSARVVVRGALCGALPCSGGMLMVWLYSFDLVLGLFFGNGSLGGGRKDCSIVTV